MAIVSRSKPHDTSLVVAAQHYKRLGYSVGLTNGKTLVDHYSRHQSLPMDEWNGISLVLNKIVCVDFDTLLHMDVGWDRELPISLREKSPNGIHLFYRLPEDGEWQTRIKWKRDIDLLVQDSEGGAKPYHDGTTMTPDRHVLVSPTPGYRRLFPNHIPELADVTMAPDWLLKEIEV